MDKYDLFKTLLFQTFQCKQNESKLKHSTYYSYLVFCPSLEWSVGTDYHLHFILK